jgi:hypothetical protein
MTVTEIPRSPPSAPRDVTLMKIAGSDSSLQVHWRNPATHNGNPLINYKVEWRHVDGSGAWEGVTYPFVYYTSYRAETLDLFNYTITGLVPGGVYTARVSADNDQGFGPVMYSSPLTERPRTAPVVIDYGAVQIAQRLADDVVTVMDSQSSLAVSWQPPSDFRGDVVTKYLVEWAEEPFTSAREQRQVIELKAAAASTITGTFKASFGNSTTDFLRWDVSASDLKKSLDELTTIRNCRVLRSPVSPAPGYRWTVIFSGHQGFGDLATLQVDPTPLSGTGVSLLVETNLTVSVCPSCVSATQFNSTIIATGDVTALVAEDSWVRVGPSEVFMVLQSTYVTASTHTVIVLSGAFQGTTSSGLVLLTGDAVPGQRLRGYNSVELQVDELSHDRLPGETEPYYFILTSLQVATPYYARVLAWNDMGWNNPMNSVPAGAAPPRQRPDQPTNVRLHVNSASSLRVFWNKPEADGGDRVTKCKIEWDTAPSFDSGASGDVVGLYEYFVTAGACGTVPCDFVITALTKGTPYYVRVSSFNS